MPEQRTTTITSTGYTGFRTVECFQVPYTWKRAGQSVGALLLVCGVAALACGAYRVHLYRHHCGDTCLDELIIGGVTVGVAALDVVLHVLLLLSLRNSWPAVAVLATVWDGLKAAGCLYLLVSSTYRLHTRPSDVVFEHYVAQVALVLCLAVAMYTLASAAHEQRTANRLEDDDSP
ncbi:uncharacterized protein LOC119103896 [Pollicipes pollicipes]|uniref:uncharacterized protein LOC119103896 n=1 Tax=Pollicipes pollicipes TaxID=41117 RepID=UPI00188593E8|nr:uncharacterized protein LOC119103896 [Pollicipes pollicipes]